MHEDIRFTAIHEAGHALAGIVYKWRFEYTSIVPAEDYLRVVQYKMDLTELIENVQGFSDTLEVQNVQTLVKTRNIVGLAGYVSELKFGRENSESARHDFDSVIDISLSY